MAEKLVINDRSTTKGGVVRVQLWQDEKTKVITRYAMAYINSNACFVDNGRVVGFDNAHAYPGHPDKHHRHWMGDVSHNKNFVSGQQTFIRFSRILVWLKRRFQKGY
ncbi:MAG: transcriptional regulator [Rhodocyclaceae bacterium]|nr:MAG: transcriptional regulator [Rhodocyclaceae bacterium]